MRKRAKLHRFRWRIFQRLIAVTLLLIATGFYFSDHILNWGVHTLSARLFPETSLSFQTVQLKKGKLQFTQVRMEGEQGEVIAPHLSIRGEFKIRPFVILPHIKMKGPQITLTEGLRALESVLYTSDKCIPSITIDNGTLLWKDHRIDFSLQSSQGKEGELRSSEHNIFCSWKQTERGLGFELNLEKAPLAIFSPLTKTFDVEISEGEVTFKGSGTLSTSFEPQVFKGEGQVHHLSGSDTKYGLAFGAQSATFTLDVPSDLKEFSLVANLIEGSLVFEDPFQQGPWELIHINGEIKRENGEPFSAQVKGAALRDVGGFPFQALAHGDSLKVWDAEVTFEDQDEAKVTLSSKPNGINISFSECDPLLIDLGQEVLLSRQANLIDWEVTEGVISGDLSLLPSGVLKIKKLIGRDLRVQNYNQRTFCSLKKGKVQGELTAQREISTLSVLFDGFDADLIQEDGEIWNLSSLAGTLSMRDHHLAASRIKGTFLGLKGEMKIEGPSLFSSTHFRLQGGVDQIVSLFSQELSEAYHEHEELPVKMKGLVQGDQTQAHVVVDFFIGQRKRTPLHFDATFAQRVLQRATFSSKRLPHTLYAPLISTIFPSLELGGEWAVKGVYEKGSLNCSMASLNALIGHSAYPLTIFVDKSGVQATLKGDFKVDCWHLSLPQFKGKLKGSKPFAFAFETTLDILKEPGRAWSTLAQVKNGHLQIADRISLSALSFEARFDEIDQTLTCRNVQGVQEAESPYAISTSELHFSKHAEKWAWGVFDVKREDQPPSTFKIEAISGGRNHQSFLLHLQKEQEPPLFFQGKTQNNVWTIDPLPEENKAAG